MLLELVLGAYTGTSGAEDRDVRLVDPDATRQTRALYSNLMRLAPDHVLFGHQDDLAYGVTWRRIPGRSDVRDVAGAYPAVYGWELGDLEHGVSENLDGVNFEDMKRWIKEGYRRGGVITISWHMDNPVSGGSAWDTTRAAFKILPGGSHHEQFKSWLDCFARFASDLKTGPLAWLGLGRPVPIIFRPWHEHSGSWFWWGGKNVTADEFKALWRFTIQYLRDVKGLNNLIYAFATDVFDSEEDYLRFYPGDEWVDILGFDDYHSVRTLQAQETLKRRLRLIVQMAERRGKVAALSETGVEQIPDSTWWTNVLLDGIESDSLGRKIAYLLVWRNANDRPNHYYAPYPGHPSAANFVEFYRDPFVLFENELPPMYK